MEANIKWIDGVNFSALTESGNTILMDGPVENGGNNNGSRPTELLISGMGGCTAFDIVCMAKTIRNHLGITFRHFLYFLVLVARNLGSESEFP